jgi:hypothetical protein
MSRLTRILVALAVALSLLTAAGCECTSYSGEEICDIPL